MLALVSCSYSIADCSSQHANIAKHQLNMAVPVGMLTISKLCNLSTWMASVILWYHYHSSLHIPCMANMHQNKPIFKPSKMDFKTLRSDDYEAIPWSLLPSLLSSWILIATQSLSDVFTAVFLQASCFFQTWYVACENRFEDIDKPCHYHTMTWSLPLTDLFPWLLHLKILETLTVHSKTLRSFDYQTIS